MTKDKVLTLKEERKEKTIVDPMQRFYNMVDVLEDGCWQWSGDLSTGGYYL